MEVLGLLDSLGIRYDKFEHKPVYTCEEASALNLDIQGIETKNLFLRDRKGKRHFLVAVPENKSVDLKGLSTVLETSALSFGSPERLKTHLGLEPGSVSVLAVVNDPDSNVELVVDEAVWQAERLQCHPLVNTATLSLSLDDFREFLDAQNRKATIVNVPEKAATTA